LESKCNGCLAAGGACCDARDEFTPSHLPPTAKGWRKEYGRYLPLLPTVYHKLESYDRKNDTLTSTGRYTLFSHLHLKSVVERDLQNPSFLGALQCE